MVAEAQSSGLVNLVFSRQTSFFECEHPFIEKNNGHNRAHYTKRTAMRPGFKLYTSNMPRMLKKDFTRFKQSFSTTPNSRKREKDSAGRVFPQQREG